MAQKFIIAGDIRDGKGYLRMGIVCQHRDLREGYEKIWGGGFWEIDREGRHIMLSGWSGDFGRPIFDHLKKMDRQWKGYTVTYREDMYSDPVEIDTDGVEWI